jgi:aryl-alcohol dehydrogenase-like predicted oxidoreductase
MRYKLLGASGLRVSELCLGTMTFGEEWGFGENEAECRKIYDAFVEAGGNFIDTANKYTEGTSEKMLGDFIASDRERIVLATKYTLAMNPADPNACGNHRKNMVQAVEASLKRLQTEYIDLLWVHAPDGMTPSEEIMRGLDDLVRQGKVFYLGISDAPAWWVARANTMAELRGWTPFSALQIKYSLIERTPERDLLPMARNLGLAVTPWGVLGGGLLSGKYLDPKGEVDSKRPNVGQEITDFQLAAMRAVAEVARETGRSASQVALAWCRQQPHAVIIPIIGARKASQIKDNLGCVEFELSAEQVQKLTDASPVDLGFPHEFLRNPEVRPFIHGETESLVDNHHPNL